jgi:hypothetical protein
MVANRQQLWSAVIDAAERSGCAMSEIGRGPRKEKMGLANWRLIIEGTSGSNGSPGLGQGGAIDTLVDAVSISKHPPISPRLANIGANPVAPSDWATGLLDYLSLHSVNPQPLSPGGG